MRDSLDYPVHFTSIVANVNMNAAYWMITHYNLYWVPTNYIDGGHSVVVGSTAGFPAFTEAIEAAGAREVTPLDLALSIEWLGEATMSIHVMLSDTISNSAPEPTVPTGTALAVTHNEYTFSSTAVDPEGDHVFLMWDFGDEITDWQGPYGSGDEVTVAHTWTEAGTHDVRVKAKDIREAESGWSGSLIVEVKMCGDADLSDGVDIDDVVAVLMIIFGGWDPPPPYEIADADCSGAVDIDDVVYLIAYIFLGGSPPCSECS